MMEEAVKMKRDDLNQLHLNFLVCRGKDQERALHLSQRSRRYGDSRNTSSVCVVLVSFFSFSFMIVVKKK